MRSLEKKISCIVVLIHLIIFVFAIFSHPIISKKPVKKRLIVETVRLTPKIASTPVIQEAKASYKENPKPNPPAHKPKPTTPKSKPVAQKTPAKKKGSSAPPKKESYHQLLEQLEQQLDAIEQPNAQHSSCNTLSVPSKIGSLQIDAPSHEKDLVYTEMLVNYLRSNLHLPEYGEVKLQLDLNEEGKVVQVKVLHSESKNNQKYLEQILPTLSFPKPQNHLSKAKKHAYVLTFCNDL